MNRLTAAGIAAVIVVAVAFGGWYVLLRDDAPPPVNLDDAIASIGTSTANATATTQEPASPINAAATATSQAAAATAEATTGISPGDGDLAGSWTVGSVGESFAGYRIGEQLASIGTNTAVGRTSAVTGTLEFDGAAITAVDIDVDMTSLVSDDSRRDRQLRSRGLETSSFPTATFTLTAPILLDGVPEEGLSIAAVAAGNLTLHGITRPVGIELTGRLVDGLVVVVGSTEILLADHDIEPPTGFSVLAVDDHGTLEFQLFFEPAG